MTEVYKLSETEILFFFMVLMRMASFVVSWPVFGVENVSNLLKVLFALIVTLIIFPTLRISPDQAQALHSDLILLAAREAFVGLAMGYLARMFFFTFRIAGEMLSQAMGLSSAQTFNPMLGGQTAAMEQVYVTLASMFYIGLNGHHFLISGLVKSYDWVPAASLHLNTSQFTGVINITNEVLILGLKFSAPVVVAILVVNLVLGVVGKTVPQLNVLVTSFPINIMVGFFLLIITLPMMVDDMGPYLQLSTERVYQFVKSF